MHKISSKIVYAGKHPLIGKYYIALEADIERMCIQCTVHEVFFFFIKRKLFIGIFSLSTKFTFSLELFRPFGSRGYRSQLFCLEFTFNSFLKSIFICITSDFF